MDYKVIVTEDAEIDMDCFINYLLFEKKNDQAASNLIDDFETAIVTLTHAAESLKLCDNQHLKALGYRRIKTMFFMSYKIMKIRWFSIFVGMWLLIHFYIEQCFENDASALAVLAWKYFGMNDRKLILLSNIFVFRNEYQNIFKLTAMTPLRGILKHTSAF